jgi:hypothetical protein
VARALRHYRSTGYKGVLAYVDATNLDSLKSCARMGFEVFGSIYVLEALGGYVVYTSPGCARFGLGVGSVPGETSTSVADLTEALSLPPRRAPPELPPWQL